MAYQPMKCESWSKMCSAWVCFDLLIFTRNVRNSLPKATPLVGTVCSTKGTRSSHLRGVKIQVLALPKYAAVVRKSLQESKTYSLSFLVIPCPNSQLRLLMEMLKAFPCFQHDFLLHEGPWQPLPTKHDNDCWQGYGWVGQGLRWQVDGWMCPVC